LQDELRRARDEAQQAAATEAAALARRGEALDRQAAEVAALRAAAADGEAALKGAQLELQLRARQAAHEEGLARDTLRQQEAALVGLLVKRGRSQPYLSPAKPTLPCSPF
jgi:hypothetical protein